MAEPNGEATTFLIEAVQTVMPMTPTDPRHSRPISVAGNVGSGVFRSRLHMTMHYTRSSEDDSGWVVAGWMKESLGQALAEQPLLSGRLRRVEDDAAAAGACGFEIVPNDSGIRLVEARISIELAEFLDLKERGGEGAEAEFVFWEDIDEDNPQYSPLFYVQVTNFKCGGYAIGITCSLLLTDPIAMTSFLKKWSNLHYDMVSKTEISRLPFFYLPSLRRTGCSATVSAGSSKLIRKQSISQSFVLEIESKHELDSDRDIKKETLAALCLEETEQLLGGSSASDFTVFIAEPESNNLKVDKFSREEIMMAQKKWGKGSRRRVRGSWHDLWGQEISFNQKDKPVRVSCWISSGFNEGIVMVTPEDDNNNNDKEASESRKCIVTVAQ